MQQKLWTGSSVGNLPQILMALVAAVMMERSGHYDGECGARIFYAWKFTVIVL